MRNRLSIGRWTESVCLLSFALAASGDALAVATDVGQDSSLRVERGTPLLGISFEELQTSVNRDLGGLDGRKRSEVARLVSDFNQHISTSKAQIARIQDGNIAKLETITVLMNESARKAVAIYRAAGIRPADPNSVLGRFYTAWTKQVEDTKFAAGIGRPKDATDIAKKLLGAEAAKDAASVEALAKKLSESPNDVKQLLDGNRDNDDAAIRKLAEHTGYGASQLSEVLGEHTGGLIGREIADQARDANSGDGRFTLALDESERKALADRGGVPFSDSFLRDALGSAPGSERIDMTGFRKFGDDNLIDESQFDENGLRLANGSGNGAEAPAAGTGGRGPASVFEESADEGAHSGRDLYTNFVTTTSLPFLPPPAPSAPPPTVSSASPSGASTASAVSDAAHTGTEATPPTTAPTPAPKASKEVIGPKVEEAPVVASKAAMPFPDSKLATNTDVPRPDLESFTAPPAGAKATVFNAVGDTTVAPANPRIDPALAEFIVPDAGLANLEQLKVKEDEASSPTKIFGPTPRIATASDEEVARNAVLRARGGTGPVSEIEAADHLKPTIHALATGASTGAEVGATLEGGLQSRFNMLLNGNQKCAGTISLYGRKCLSEDAPLSPGEDKECRSVLARLIDYSIASRLKGDKDTSSPWRSSLQKAAGFVVNEKALQVEKTTHALLVEQIANPMAGGIAAMSGGMNLMARNAKAASTPGFVPLHRFMVKNAEMCLTDSTSYAGKAFRPLAHEQQQAILDKIEQAHKLDQAEVAARRKEIEKNNSVVASSVEVATVQPREGEIPKQLENYQTLAKARETNPSLTCEEHFKSYRRGFAVSGDSPHAEARTYSRFFNYIYEGARAKGAEKIKKEWIANRGPAPITEIVATDAGGIIQQRFRNDATLVRDAAAVTLGEGKVPRDLHGKGLILGPVLSNRTVEAIDRSASAVTARMLFAAVAYAKDPFCIGSDLESDSFPMPRPGDDRWRKIGECPEIGKNKEADRMRLAAINWFIDRQPSLVQNGKNLVAYETNSQSQFAYKTFYGGGTAHVQELIDRIAESRSSIKPLSLPSGAPDPYVSTLGNLLQGCPAWQEVFIEAEKQYRVAAAGCGSPEATFLSTSRKPGEAVVGALLEGLKRVPAATDFGVAVSVPTDTTPVVKLASNRVESIFFDPTDGTAKLECPAIRKRHAFFLGSIVGSKLRTPGAKDSPLFTEWKQRQTSTISENAGEVHVPEKAN